MDKISARVEEMVNENYDNDINVKGAGRPRIGRIFLMQEKIYTKPRPIYLLFIYSFIYLM